MIKRFFSSSLTSITGAALVLGAASFFSRLIGLLRDRLFAHMFGTGDTLDIYYSAFRIPDLIYQLLVAGALTAGFIPVFLEIYVKNKKKAFELSSVVLTTLFIVLGVISLLALIFSKQLVDFMVPGFDLEKKKATLELTRILFLSPLILSISGVFSGILQSIKSFIVYSLTPIMYNLGIILGVILFYPHFGIKGLGFGVILGAILHLAIQIPTAISAGFRPKFKLDFKNKYLKEIAVMMIPRTLALGTTQLNLLVMTIIASTLSAGSITVFQFASNLQYFPIGLIGISFALAAFPTFSELIAKKKFKKMSEYLISSSRQILFFIVPITVIFLLLRAQIVRLALGSGAFDWTATTVTADTLAFFSISLFAQCLIPLFTRAFYALKDTWTPFYIAFVSALINIIGSLVLKENYGIAGLSLAFSLSMIVQFILLILYIKGDLRKHLRLDRILFLLNKIVPAGIFMAIIIQLLKYPLANIVNMETFVGVFLQTLITSVAGFLSYFLICGILGVPEMQQFKKAMSKRFLNFKKVQGEVHDAENF